MFSTMLTDAFQDCDAGFPIRYRFHCKLFNLRRLQAKSMVQTYVLDKLLYADGMAENAKTETKMQGAMDRACDSCDLTISTKRICDLTISTKRMRQYTSQHLESRVSNQTLL